MPSRRTGGAWNWQRAIRASGDSVGRVGRGAYAAPVDVGGLFGVTSIREVV